MVRIVLVTVPDEETGLRLARRLTEEHLVACVNVVPGLTSLYRWEGEVQEDREVLLVIKTTDAALGEVESRVVELHPYEVPEVLALPVVSGLSSYVEWVAGEVNPSVSKP